MADFTNMENYVAMYNSSLPTLSDGQVNGLQVDVNGRLLVAANITVSLDHTEDSVQIGDGTANTMAVNANGSINVEGTFWQATQPVSGTFWQATQPVSGPLTDTELRATPVPVSAADLDIRDLDAAQDNVAISDGSDTLAVNADGSINVTVNNASIAVTGTFWQATQPVSGTFWQATQPVSATDLDIRQLLHSGGTPDSVQIGDGTETLAVNADGSINVVDIGTSGTENDVSTDPSGDGIVQLTAGPDVVVSQAVAAGEIYKIHGWSWASDRQCILRLEVYDGAVLVEIIRTTLNSGANPSDSMNFGTPIEITGAATRVLRVSAKRLEGANGNASAGINGTLD